MTRLQEYDIIKSIENLNLEVSFNAGHNCKTNSKR